VEPKMRTAGPLPAPSYAEIDRYNVIYDTNPWSDDDTASQTQVPLFDVYTTLETSAKTQVCRIPVLDQIRDVLMKNTQVQHNLTLPDVPELYKCVQSGDAQGNVVFQFTMLKAELISRAADSYDPKNPDNLDFSNLKFTKLGITDTLPFVFSIMQFTLSFDGTSVSGFARDFDPNMVAFDGKRHRIFGIWHDPKTAMKRRNISKGTVGTKPGSPLSAMANSHLPPSKVPVNLATAFTTVPQDLTQGARELAQLELRADVVQQRSQGFIFQAMKFQMTDDQLSNFMGEVRPTVGTTDPNTQVPPNLSASLSFDVAEWIKEKYIPAFIGRMIMNASADTKATWRRSLTAKEEKQITYWWTGKGSGCLSQSKMYNTLNEIAAREAILSIQPRLFDYKNDPHPVDGLTGGDKWAKALYQNQSQIPALNQISNSLGTKDLGGWNKLQKLCNILQVLQPIPTVVPQGGWTIGNEPYAQRLVAAIRGMQSDPFQMQFVSLSNDPFVQDEAQWLFDAMDSLYQALFSSDPTKRLSGPTADRLRQDAVTLAEAIGLKSIETKDMQT
ncbi:hypothetical protein K432DRAFT_309998, partial [Lepidopterella palustris CBS 459.81]